MELPPRPFTRQSSCRVHLINQPHLWSQSLHNHWELSAERESSFPQPGSIPAPWIGQKAEPCSCSSTARPGKATVGLCIKYFRYRSTWQLKGLISPSLHLSSTRLKNNSVRANRKKKYNSYSDKMASISSKWLGFNISVNWHLGREVFYNSLFLSQVKKYIT